MMMSITTYVNEIHIYFFVKTGSFPSQDTIKRAKVRARSECAQIMFSAKKWGKFKAFEQRLGNADNIRTDVEKRDITLDLKLV